VLLRWRSTSQSSEYRIRNAAGDRTIRRWGSCLYVSPTWVCFVLLSSSVALSTFGQVVVLHDRLVVVAQGQLVARLDQERVVKAQVANVVHRRRQQRSKLR